MKGIENYNRQLKELGFSIIDAVYNSDEIKSIIKFIENLDSYNPIFRKSDDLFAIRQFMKEFPEIQNTVFNENLKTIIKSIGDEDYFIVKSIYFDKPEKSNWFVSYHQDLTISVDKRQEVNGFSNWTNKHNQYAVQPTLDILENIFTIRIHLDDTTKENGALKVIEKSNLKGVTRIENLDFTTEKEVFCEVKSGGIMLMKPLLFHASNKTTNNNKRRVLHIEFSNVNLPNQLNWSEYSKI